MEKRSALSSVIRLSAMLKPYIGRMFIASIALTVAALTVLSIGKGLQFLIDHGLQNGDDRVLDRALIILFVVIVVLACASFVRSYLVAWLGERLIADLRHKVYAHLVHLDPSFYETNNSGELASRLTADLTLLQTVIATSIPIALRNSLLFIGGLIMLLITSPKLAGLVLAVVPLVVIPILAVGRIVRSRSRITQDRVGDIGAHVGESLRAVKTIQSYTHEKISEDHFQEHVSAAFDAAKQHVKSRSFLSSLVIVIVFSAIGIILWTGGHDVLSGHMSGGELSAFIFYAVLVAGAVGAISDVFSSLYRAIGATDRIFDLLATQTSIQEPDAPQSLIEPIDSLSFSAVSFHYLSRKGEPALQDISFDVKGGETIAIVGPSGAGKTTIFELLLRFYDPQFGEITINSCPVRDMRLCDLRQRVALVPQNPFIFTANIYDNIAFGNPNATRDQVVEATRQANLLDFVAHELEHGFDTLVGEGGNQLSGGQKQRLAIARAFLKDAPILLLDEVTGALDAENERKIQDSLDNIMRDKTTLIIAHRLSTIMRADRILVMEHGRIVESGTHEELVKSKKLYAKLAELQFTSGTDRSIH